MWTIEGKHVLVTGATSGIGLEAAAQLAQLGARVSIVGRDAARISAAARVIESRSGHRPTTFQADFASLSDVRALASQVAQALPALHVLINNAGSVFARRTLTVDGIEATWAVNHLAPFLLTQQLQPLLVASAPARVITVASGRHFKGTLDFDDMGFARGYGILQAYARSKVANVLFASELARRLDGSGVTSNSVHPGRVATNIWSGAPAWAKPLIRVWLSRTFIRVPDGAAPLVTLATGPDLERATGQYFDRFTPTPPAPLAQDAACARRLWDYSARVVTAA